MRLLLDTHSLLWYSSNDSRLPKQMVELIDDAHNKCMISTASMWEIAIKIGVGKLQIGVSLDDLWNECVKSDFELLLINMPEITFVANMPLHHRDPFDRILIAQLDIYQLPIVSGDAVFDQYGANRIW